MNDAVGTLYVVATPIGNLEDITLRALRILREVDYVLCEDTRVTGKLFARHNIATKLKRYDAHASDKTHLDIINDIKGGKQVALVSDAGTPGVSDPGVMLVQMARAKGARVEAIPGPSALTAALSIAGIAGNQFTFLGFAPAKKGRETFFKSLGAVPQPAIFFESTHRILKTLEALQKQSNPNSTVNRTIRVTVARELTKLHEEVLVGTPEEILGILKQEPVKQKGEFVVLAEVGG